eukprot:scaffold64107_cov95-Phaeocystis_antarctica.AAC.1
MGQPGGACFSPLSHRTSRLRAEPRVQFWRTADSLVITYHPCRTCCAPTPARRATRLPPPTAYTLLYAPAVQLASQHLYQPFTAPNLDT